MAIELTDGVKKEAIASIERYFRENMEEPIGNLTAGALLSFFLEEIGPAIYNKGVADAQQRMYLRVSRDLLQQANLTRDGQWPFATIVSCIDSRTSAELIFDQGLGDIFSVRIAGNVINTDIIGSLEFACHVAGSKLIVVLGHTSCGAIKGACDHVELGNLTELLSKIQPAVYEENKIPDPATRNSKNAAFVENVADLNVRRSVRSIVNRSYILEHMIAAGKVGIIGGKHDLASGEVTFFEDTWLYDEASLRSIAG